MNRSSLLIIAILFSSGSHSAETLSAAGKKNQIFDMNGITYGYTSSKINNRTDAIDHDEFEISVKNRNQETIFFQKTNQSPGCDRNTPAIQIIDIPAENTNRKTRLMAFCGSHSGKFNTMRFYQPDHGMVYAIDFGNSAPALYSSNNNTTDAIVYKEAWIHSAGTKISYPAIHELTASGGIIISHRLSTSKKYSNLLDNDYYLSNTSRAKIEKLIILALSESSTEFCLQARDINKPGLLEELRSKTPINYPECEKNQPTIE